MRGSVPSFDFWIFSNWSSVVGSSFVVVVSQPCYESQQSVENGDSLWLCYVWTFCALFFDDNVRYNPCRPYS